MINIIGNILGISGYDIHTRELAKALNKVTEARLTVQIPEGGERMLSDEELEMVKRPAKEDEINLIVTNPIFWRLNAIQEKNFVYLIHEGNYVPIFYIEEILSPLITKVLVASSHTLEAVENTLEKYEFKQEYKAQVLNKIEIIPHGVDSELFTPKPKPEDEKKFVFVCNKGYRNMEDRGGIQYAIKAFVEEFNEKDNVALFLKINPAYGVVDMAEVIKSLTEKKADFPEIRLNNMALDYKDMPSIYQGGDVFLAPTRAEAFNIPCLEAMACGLPVITTFFGGQTDYVDTDNGWIIKGKLEEVQHELQYEGNKWCTPDINELRKALREAYEDEEKRKKKSKLSRERAKSMSWAQTAKKIVALIN